jgi:hypothetical protein
MNPSKIRKNGGSSYPGGRLTAAGRRVGIWSRLPWPRAGREQANLTGRHAPSYYCTRTPARKPIAPARKPAAPACFWAEAPLHRRGTAGTNSGERRPSNWERREERTTRSGAEPERLDRRGGGRLGDVRVWDGDRRRWCSCGLVRGSQNTVDCGLNKNKHEVVLAKWSVRHFFRIGGSTEEL